MKDNTAAVHVQVPVDVATFLLNEKRAEIHEIESRFRTSIMLVPNIHMETPNYSILRRRHEELSSDELPSYRMVEMPAETAVEKASPTEAKPPRQMAAVRGITPGQPAPVMAESKGKDKRTWLGKIKNWLQNLGGAKEEEVKPKARPARTEKRREPRGEARRGEREGERGESRRAERGEGRGGERGEGRGGQKPRGPAQPSMKKEAAIAAQETAPVVSAAPADRTGETEGQEPRSRRGRRGGRRERGERQEAPRNIPASTEGQAEMAVKSPEPEAVSLQTEKVEVTPVTTVAILPKATQEAVAITETPSESVKPVAEVAPVVAVQTGAAPAAPVTITEAPSEQAKPAVEPAPAVAVQIEATQAAPVAIAEVPQEASKPRAPRRRTPQPKSAPSELLQVETSPEKIKQVIAETTESTEAEKPRPRRIPRPKVVEESAPLVQIETRK